MPVGRRHRLGVTVVVLVLVVAALIAASDDGESAGSPAEPVAATGAPNIVLILTDDLSVADMRFLPKTTALLGDQGATFTQFTAPQPLCCPSRAQLLTGQYAQNNGVRHNNGPYGGYQAFDASTALPTWLQQGGYQTAMVGKYLNGYGVDAASRAPQEIGWDHWDPTIRNVYNYYGYTQHNDGNPLQPGEYHTDYVGQKSDELIADMAADDQPFFLWSSFVAPHGVCKVAEEAGGCDTPPLAAPEYAGGHRDVSGAILGAPSFDAVDRARAPRILTQAPEVTPAQVELLQDARADSLASVDDAVSGIVETLEETGELDNTLIAFTSDNGYLLGEHRFIGKILAYEEAVRVPLLIRGPGVPGGSVDDQTAAMIDLAPTFAALARVVPPITVDGRPIVLRRAGADVPDGRTLLLQAGVANLQRYPAGWWFRGVRTARYTYVHWLKDDVVELYDRGRDQYQVDNLAGDPAYAAVERELARRTTKLGGCSGTACRAYFGPVPQPTLDLTITP